MTGEDYKRLLIEAKQLDFKWEKPYDKQIFIPRGLNERMVERIKQLNQKIRELETEVCNAEVEIKTAKEELRKNGIKI